MPTLLVVMVIGAFLAIATILLAYGGKRYGKGQS